MDKDSASAAKLFVFTLLLLSNNPRPSAAKRLSKGIVYPRGFFQFEIQVGITHASCSSLVNFVGGACKTGTGSSAGPRGALTCLCLGGMRGSSLAGTICMIRVAAAGL